MNVPDSFARRLKDQYPQLQVKWNERRHVFEIIETFRKGAVDLQRVVATYENADGTPVPFVGDHCMEMIHAMDTKRWPLKERVRQWREDKAKADEAPMKEALNAMRDRIADDDIYFSSAERFFMDPKSMPEWKTKFRPSQARILKTQGIM